MTKPAHILLVTNNTVDAELTLSAFRQTCSRNTFHIASSGQAALDYLLEQSPSAGRQPHPLPNLILLDLQVSDIDGLEVLRRIKAAPPLKRLPVVILTSSQEASDLAESYDIGANSYLVKPASFSGLLDLVRHIEAYWFDLNVTSSWEDC